MAPSDESLDGYREARPIRLTFSDLGRSVPMRKIVMSLLVVAEIVVLLLVLAVEFRDRDVGIRDRDSESRKREDYIRGHEVMARDVQRLLDEASSLNPADPKLTVALERLLAWHERRVTALRRAGDFMFQSETNRDLLETPTPRDPAVWNWINTRLYPKSR